MEDKDEYFLSSAVRDQRDQREREKRFKREQREQRMTIVLGEFPSHASNRLRATPTGLKIIRKEKLKSAFLSYEVAVYIFHEFYASAAFTLPYPSPLTRWPT